MVQELPKPPWYRRVWTLYLAIAVVTVGALAATVALRSQAAQRADPPAATDAPVDATPPNQADATRQATTLPPRTTVRAKLGVFWQKTGSAGHYGALFDVPNGWRLVWSFNCRSFAKYGGGNFKISGEGKLDDVSVQTFAVKASGTERVPGGGRGRLVIETVCDRWTVRAIKP
jgi:hypothetical protein